MHARSNDSASIDDDDMCRIDRLHSIELVKRLIHCMMIATNLDHLKYLLKLDAVR